MRNMMGIVGISLLAATQVVLGAGYERSVIWSGKQDGVAGAGASTVHNSEAIYFNPAGLADVKGLEVSGNFSPTSVRSKAPVAADGTQITSDSLFLPAAGFTAAYQLTDGLAVGAGAFVGGGSRVKYSSVANIETFDTDYSSQITMMEYSLGLGYQIVPGLKLGAAWRILHASGLVSLPTRLGETIHFDNLAQTKYNGFRAGAQYDGSSWGLGFSMRSNVDFTLSGDLSAQSAANTTTSFGTGTISNSFPFAASLGGYVDLMGKQLRLIGEYTYANYSKNQQVDLTGNVGLDLASTPIIQHWKDLNMGRVGAEYRGWGDWVARAGYALVGEVTPNADALPTFSSPGIGHTYLQNHLDVDLAVDYSFASGTVDRAETDLTLYRHTGDYSSRAMAGHIGATYRF
jgi:long-chain fatty acid transport protein